MSLKSRLRISIVLLVTGLVLMQCVATLRLTIEDKFSEVQDRAEVIKEQTRLQVQQRVNELVSAVPKNAKPSTFDETKALVHELVATDPFLPEIFVAPIASSRTVSEIQLCDDQGVVLRSSSKQRSRQTYLSLPLFDDWRRRPLWERIWEVWNDTRDYAMVIPLGMSKDPSKRVLDLRIVVSTLFIRDSIKKQVRTLAGSSALSLLAAMVLAYLFSNVILNHLDRLSKRIESITTGEFTLSDGESAGKEPKEFAEMTSKLDVLSQQYRGAREDMVQMRRNIDGMLERLEEGVILFDARRKVVSASRSAERILALDQSALVGKQLEELFPASTALGALLREVCAEPRKVIEAPVTHNRGAVPLRLLANVDLVEGPDRSTSILLRLRDIESRRQLRTQLDISTRLAAISGLTGGVAHEIKNPLNAMAVHLEVLKEKLSGEASVQNEVGVIGGEIARLDRVVKTFLDFTRPVQLDLKRVDIVDLARQVATLVWPGAERGAVSVELEARVPHAWARVDEDMIKQALINVVNNGVEAMKGGGRLRIGVGIEGDEIVVTVSDQGPGIPAEVRDKIFNLYFTTKAAGSGIGLAMTFRHIQLHNGTIDFTSDPLSGTTFRMRFPADDLETPASERKAADVILVNSSVLAKPNAVESTATEGPGQ